MEITAAQLTDVGGILDVRAIVRTDYYPNEELGIYVEDVWHAQAMQRANAQADLIAQLDDPEHYHVDVLRADDGTVVGYCVSSKSEAYGNRLDYIHILSEFQGAGFGGQLIERTLDWLGDDEPVQLEVVTYNERGKSIWEKLGFVAIGMVPDEYSRTADGTVIPHYLMERPARQKDTSDA